MTNVNTFAGARIRLAGKVRGVDEKGHDVYIVDRTEGPALFGEYFEVSPGENENHFNIEIGHFGFTNPESAGNPYPSARQGFSTEEVAAAQKLIQDFFSNPGVVMEVWQHTPEVRFLGGVRFRLDWIVQNPSGH
jgi:hypothetical protein